MRRSGGQQNGIELLEHERASAGSVRAVEAGAVRVQGFPVYPETVRQSGYAVLSGPAVDMH